MRHSLILLSLLTISCNQSVQEQKVITQIDTLINIDTTLNIEKLKRVESVKNEEKFKYQTIPFEVEKYYSNKIDTSNFINALESNCNLYSSRDTSKTLDKFQKIKLNGSKRFFYFIQFSFSVTSNVEFPGKFQIVLNEKGKLLKVVSAIRVDLVNVNRNENPYLFAFSSTAHGNGGHEIFRINNDTIEQVYDGFLGNRPQTYSTGYDNDENIPNELPHKFIDDNNDGLKDLMFYGKVRYSKIDLGTDDKIADVKFIFLYNKTNGHFTEKEDYSEKYKFIYGKTK